MRIDDVEYCVLYAGRILQICLVNKSIPTVNQYQELLSCNTVISSKGNDSDKKSHLKNLENAKSEFLKDDPINSKHFDDLISHFKTCCNNQNVSINTSPTKGLRSI